MASRCFLRKVSDAIVRKGLIARPQAELVANIHANPEVKTSRDLYWQIFFGNRPNLIKLFARTKRQQCFNCLCNGFRRIG